MKCHMTDGVVDPEFDKTFICRRVVADPNVRFTYVAFGLPSGHLQLPSHHPPPPLPSMLTPVTNSFIGVIVYTFKYGYVFFNCGDLGYGLEVPNSRHIRIFSV